MKKTKKMIVVIAICVVALQHHNHIHSAQPTEVKNTPALSGGNATAKEITLFPGNMLWDF